MSKINYGDYVVRYDGQTINDFSVVGLVVDVNDSQVCLRAKNTSGTVDYIEVSKEEITNVRDFV